MVNQDLNIGRFTEYFQVPKGSSKEDIWKNIEQRISVAEKQKKPKKSLTVVYAIVSTAVAAVALYAIFSVGLKLNPRSSDEIITSFGEVKQCWLPDSSLVVLNTNSSLQYSYNNLPRKRTILLKGDALFDIKKGADFVVSFFGGEVKVKGTSFYVSAYSPRILQVDCIDGAVDVSFNNKTLSLTKNQGVKCYNGVVSHVYSCDENDVRSRIEGIFYWEKISLAEIEELTEYRFGYNVILSPELGDRNFSGQLDFNDMEASLMVIAIAMDIEYTIDEERKIISLNAK